MNLYDINVIKSLLKKHNFSFSKSLGQNFLIDCGVCPKMVAESGITGDSGVLEIGPGFGVLTSEIAKQAGKVVAVELDKRLLPVLSETLHEFENVTILNGDILKLDLHSLLKEQFGDMDIYICANLPYYITSPVIMQLLESRLPIKNITVMVQKEAAERLCAQVGSREAGAVTVAVDYYAHANELFDVPRECFYPSPNVDSSVIRLDVRKAPPISVTDEKSFFKLVKSAFSQRRKTAANSISSCSSFSKQDIVNALSSMALDVNIRAEKLTMAEFTELNNILYSYTIH